MAGLNGAYTVISSVFGGVNTVITVATVNLNSAGTPKMTKGIVSTYSIVYPGTQVEVGDGQATIADNIRLPVVSMSVGAKTFTLTGDLTALFVAPLASQVLVLDNSAFPWRLTFVSAVYGAGQTVVTVTDDISGLNGAATLQPLVNVSNTQYETQTEWGSVGTGLTINVTAVS